MTEGTSATSPATSREKYRALLDSASKTAGCDNWKTSAGRVDGPDGFVVGDAWRLLKIHFKGTTRPSSCPICMERPSSDDEWYITKSCRHAVCRSCLRGYALSLISDVNHTGPLKCPCCPRLLRVEDAKAALDDRLVNENETTSRQKKNMIPKSLPRLSPKKSKEKGGLFEEPVNYRAQRNALEVLEKWENKARDEFLRSMGDFRPCPHCSKGNEGGNSETMSASSKNGGGFVTPSCLAPITEARESRAELLLGLAGNPSAMAAILVYAIYYVHCGRIQTKHPELQIIFAVMPCVLLPILPQAFRLCLACIAKREVMRPIIVTCPCCENDFNLDAASELEVPGSSPDSASEVASQQWKSTNTRPCPRCSSPIMKAGGCNHVKCGKCHVDFCWACMRPRTSCRAYRCRNGAPFGNAFGDGSMRAIVDGLARLERESQGRTLVERIDHVETTALRNLRLFRIFPLRHLSLICLAYVAVSRISSLRDATALAQVAFWRIALMASTAVFSSTGIFCAVMLVHHYVRQERTNLEGPDVLGDGGTRGRFRAEDIAEAVARSLVEQ